MLEREAMEALDRGTVDAVEFRRETLERGDTIWTGGWVVWFRQGSVWKPIERARGGVRIWRSVDRAIDWLGVVPVSVPIVVKPRG